MQLYAQLCTNYFWFRVSLMARDKKYTFELLKNIYHSDIFFQPKKLKTFQNSMTILTLWYEFLMNWVVQRLSIDCFTIE